jgi:hypothetical protein
MYFAHLGMMAHMNGGSGMSMPGTPTAAMTNSPMAAAAAAAAAGGMSNPMLFSMMNGMNPQQLAAFTAAQQQWQANMAPSTIANIAAAAAVAATAASNPEVSERSCVQLWNTLSGVPSCFEQAPVPAAVTSACMSDSRLCLLCSSCIDPNPHPTHHLCLPAYRGLSFFLSSCPAGRHRLR